jgi:tetratricopeptide (TPR) repeat protein
VTRTIVATVLLAAAAGGGAVAYQTAARQREYQSLVARGDAALGQRLTFLAIEGYSGAIALKPDSMLAHLRRGETYQQRGDLDSAARDFRVAAALDRGATRPLEALGDIQFHRHRFARAADAYESFLALDDQSPRVAYKLALARYRGGDVEATLTSLRRAIAANDQMPDAYYLLGLCLRDRNQLPAAIDAFERSVALSPALIAAHEELADLYTAAGRHAEAIEQLQLIAGLDRTHVGRQVALGLAQARAGKGELAVLTLLSALERTPDEPLIHGAIGQVWLDMASERSDALSKALEALERVAGMPTATSEVMTLYGRALLRANRPEDAERVLQQAIRRYPVEPSAFLHYAGVAEGRGHLEAARQALIEYGSVVSEEADYAGRAMTIGRLSLKVNDAASARTWLERAAAAPAEDPRVQAMLAEAQLRTGDRDAAAATVARGLQKDPRHAALRAIARRLH